MMGIPPSEARDLSYWEYTALLTVWNERHSPNGADRPSDLPRLRRFMEAHGVG